MMRSLPLLIITAVHISCFAAAGLLSSQIASTKSGQALVDNSICGYPQKLPDIQAAYLVANLTPETVPIFTTQVSLGRYTVTKAASYVRSCYNDDPARSADCNRFIRRNLMLQGSANLKAQCPFGNGSCITPAVIFDTGLLSSNDDLGLNSPTRDSLSFRRMTTCAPIKVDMYATSWRDNLTEGYGGKTTTSVRFYEFGKSKTESCVATKTNRTSSSTFCISQWMKDYLPGAYLITATTAYANQPNVSDFDPVPDFQVSNADTTLLSIFSKATYSGKVDDALFNAQNQTKKSALYYSAVNDMSVLACTEQLQFCNSASGKCTDMGGLYDARKAVERGDLSLSQRQTATFKIMWEAAWAMSMQWTAKLMNSRLLLAQDAVYTATDIGSGTLPPNQWQLESFNLHNLSLAVFQHRLNQYAAPETFQLTSTLNAADKLDIPTDPEMKSLCKRQRIISSSHYNVSVLGMAVIICISTLLILLDLSLEKIWFNYFRPGTRIAKQADWTQTSTLQLHRQAVEARGIGPWDRKADSFPVLDGGAMFPGIGAREERIGEHQEESDEKLPYNLVAGEVPSEEIEKIHPQQQAYSQHGHTNVSQEYGYEDQKLGFTQPQQGYPQQHHGYSQPPFGHR